jgi:dTDP-4-dehydrorhamnose reductase
VALAELMLERDPAGRGMFHAAGADAVTWARFAEMIFAGSAARGGPAARVRPVTAEAFAAPAKRPKDSRLACRRLEAATGWRAPALAEALDRCLDRVAFA